jgi:hypothetical protein
VLSIRQSIKTVRRQKKIRYQRLAADNGFLTGKKQQVRALSTAGLVEEYYPLYEDDNDDQVDNGKDKLHVFHPKQNRDQLWFKPSKASPEMSRNYFPSDEIRQSGWKPVVTA